MDEIDQSFCGVECNAMESVNIILTIITWVLQSGGHWQKGSPVDHLMLISL